MILKKIDRTLMRFFLEFVSLMAQIKISPNTLINIFLILHLGTQITQIILLHNRGKGIWTILVMTIPAWMFLWYFMRIVKLSKEGPVKIDSMRTFSVMYVGIRIFLFFYYWILSEFHLSSFFKQDFFYQVIYTLNGIIFMCVLYLLSCGPIRIATETKKEVLQ